MHVRQCFVHVCDDRIEDLLDQLSPMPSIVSRIQSWLSTASTWAAMTQPGSTRSMETISSSNVPPSAPARPDLTDTQMFVLGTVETKWSSWGGSGISELLVERGQPLSEWQSRNYCSLRPAVPSKPNFRPSPKKRHRVDIRGVLNPISA